MNQEFLSEPTEEPDPGWEGDPVNDDWFTTSNQDALEELQNMRSLGRSPTEDEESDGGEYFSASELEPEPQDELPF